MIPKDSLFQALTSVGHEPVFLGIYRAKEDLNEYDVAKAFHADEQIYKIEDFGTWLLRHGLAAAVACGTILV